MLQHALISGVPKKSSRKHDFQPIEAVRDHSSKIGPIQDDNQTADAYAENKTGFAQLRKIPPNAAMSARPAQREILNATFAILPSMMMKVFWQVAFHFCEHVRRDKNLPIIGSAFSLR